MGQDILTVETFDAYNKLRPDWFETSNIETELNITEMLAAGEQPVNQVIADLKSLTSGTIYKITAPFVAAPLIDKAISLDFDHWIDEQKDGTFFIYFRKNSS